ncbi:hypothetical protein PR048_022397 [Dryococelus australis]|uniref:Alanine--glyoxylate aminotransferase 2, mitochondrial n=1 Tax=Dryococelus australis TaxID=614101 RepID=A0ABQ9H0X4_9NEOP|nr:hypothetical protein PR048_022397 [Dryococelus australis]
MPACEFQPRKYTGPGYEKVWRIRSEHLLKNAPTYYKKPLLIHEGNMQWLFDHRGRRYLDMFGGIVTVSVGHCHPKVVEAAEEQMKSLWHTTNIYLHPKLYEYAEKLLSTLPKKLQVAYFVNSGSEANDIAMLLARLHTGSYDIISFCNAYHGMSMGAMALTAMCTWKHAVPSAFGVHHAMNPDVYRGVWGGAHCRDSPIQTVRECSCTPGECAASEQYYGQLEEVFKYSLPRGRIAGIFAESIQGIGGTVQFPKGLLKKAKELVKSNGGIYIADEVQTGFGRTGEHFWGFEMHGVEPDIVTMAKGMGNGFPLAAVVTTPEIASKAEQALHFSTFGGNPVASAVGLAVLEVIKEEKLQQRSHDVGTYLLQQLAGLRDKFECVGDVRGKGLMIGVEMVEDKDSRRPLPAKSFLDVWEDCKDMGLLLGRGGLSGNVFRIKPPMCITKADADFTIAVLEKALCKFTEKRERLLH